MTFTMESIMRTEELSLETVLSPALCKIWDHSLMGVMVIDAQGVICYMNRLLVRTDDLQGEDIIGQKMIRFYPLERDCHLSIQTLETGRPIIKKTIVYYTRKKKLVNSLCSSFPLIHRGRVQGVIHFSLNLQTSQNLLERHGTPVGDALPLPMENQPYTFASLIGENPGFRNVVDQAQSASQTPFNVFVAGESGCGKELFAQAIHQASQRAGRPFVPINCAAIPDNLLETTLFGTAKGAFTGAIDKPGLLEEAQGGTLLLDELNSMSLELQAKLLRVIQEKKIRRVGALKEIPVAVSFISTCNISPARALDQGLIRADLFYRLAVVVLEIPPLRQRISDIPLLCRHFLKILAKRCTCDAQPRTITLSPGVKELFNAYPWPGNVRELEHALKAATAALGEGEIIEPDHLSAYFMDNYQKQVQERVRSGETGESQPRQPLPGMDLPTGGTMDLNDTLRSLEARYIRNALDRAGYNISKAGRFLNLSPQALRYKIRRLGIQIPRD
ncbi:MAG: sigma 54-interacting transcriptional regulator [Desulfobacterales bacterium]|nr:sigma 54-interacting transcriptional regulator [Desulfobacterales bacterium]